ncbi:MAG: SsrA-binding protein SmpB [Defluviitaleaceae bacterium]|nr:SsrA-binding protein SmpB [Defluviitaleaceae bacterium]
MQKKLAKQANKLSEYQQGKFVTKLIASNKKASHDYFIEETFQSGIALVGTEVKSLRMGRCNLKESFIKIINNEAYILGMHIAPYEKGNIFNKDPLRNRKLLLSRKEINRLIGASTKEGYTIVATKVYFKGSLVKLDIGLAKGKKLHDKREAIARKDMQRETEREFREKFK